MPEIQLVIAIIGKIAKHEYGEEGGGNDVHYLNGRIIEIGGIDEFMIMKTNN